MRSWELQGIRDSELDAEIRIASESKSGRRPADGSRRRPIRTKVLLKPEPRHPSALSPAEGARLAIREYRKAMGG